MNFHRLHFFAGAARRLCAGLALLGFLAAGHAEPVDGGRWLFIFDTSSAMKKMLPATEVALKQFLIISAGGELAGGDSVAVWTVGHEVSGKFPTFTWLPEQAVTSTSNLLTFLDEQRYWGNPKLSLLQAPISRVVANSQRLTIILFCDGQSDITGTPYDETINQVFRASKAERKKSRQPFIVILRSQFGKIIGSTVNLPPGKINLPFFPPLPEPPTPAPPVTNNPAPPAPAPPPVVVTPVVTGPDLVIVGTRVGTNLDMLLATNPPVQNTNSEPANPSTTPTNVPATQPATTSPVTNEVKAPVTNTPATNPLVISSAIETNAAAEIPMNSPDQPTKVLIYLGVVLLAAAGLLVLILLARNRRRTQSSLITSSMQDVPPRRK
jgi:hypothetical protein